MNEPTIYQFATNWIPDKHGKDTFTVNNYVLASEHYRALIAQEKVHRRLTQDPTMVFIAMSCGGIAPISMEKCAEVHGPEMLEKWNRFVEWEKAQS